MFEALTTGLGIGASSNNNNNGGGGDGDGGVCEKGSMIADAILQIGLMPAAIVLPNLTNRLKATEQDLMLKRTISTFQALLREKEEEILILEQKLSLRESLPGISGGRQLSAAEQQAAQQRLASSITKLVSTLYSSKGRDEGPRRDELVDTLDKMRLCLRTIQTIGDDDWQAILEPVGDTLLHLQTEQQRRSSVSSMLDRISTSSQVNLYSQAQYLELENSINAAKATQNGNQSLDVALKDINGETTTEANGVKESSVATGNDINGVNADDLDIPNGDHGNGGNPRLRLSQFLAVQNVPLDDHDLEKLLVALGDDCIDRLVSLQVDKKNRDRLQASPTLVDSGNVSPLSGINPAETLQFADDSTNDVCKHSQSALVKADSEEQTTMLLALRDTYGDMLKDYLSMPPDDLRALLDELSRKVTEDAVSAVPRDEQSQTETPDLELALLGTIEDRPIPAPLDTLLQQLHNARLDESDTTQLTKQVRDSVARALIALGEPVEGADLFVRMLNDSCRLVRDADDVRKSAEAARTQVNLEAQVEALLETRANQSARIRELQALIETYRATATQLNSNLSRDITALSSISDDVGVVIRPQTTYKQQQTGMDKDIRGSTASLQLDLSRSDIAAAAADAEGETRTNDRYDVRINVQLDAGRVESRVKLIDCERVIDELHRKIDVLTKDLESAEKRNGEMIGKDREIEMLRSKIEIAQQAETALKQQVLVLNDTVASLRKQNGGLLQDQLQALSMSDASSRLELIDLDAERHRLYKSSREDGAIIHKLQLTIRETELANRRLKTQLDIIQSSQGGTYREINDLKSTIDDLSMQLDDVRLQCAAWQRKANNYRRTAANIMAKLSSYKQQIRGLVLADGGVKSHPHSESDVRALRNSLTTLSEYHTETFNFESN